MDPGSHLSLLAFCIFALSASEFEVISREYDTRTIFPERRLPPVAFAPFAAFHNVATRSASLTCRLAVLPSYFRLTTHDSRL